MLSLLLLFLNLTFVFSLILSFRKYLFIDLSNNVVKYKKKNKNIFIHRIRLDNKNKMQKGKRKATKAPEESEKTFEPFEENVCL